MTKTVLHHQLHHIVGIYGCVIIERTGTDVYGFLLSHDILYQHRVSCNPYYTVVMVINYCV